jgi:hypothetical protein
MPSPPTGRRGFLTATAGVLGLGSALASARDDPKAADATTSFTEPARVIPCRDGADVIVCGGGPAGTAAALAAARSGARVRLFELQGALGGVWTSGLLTYIFDFAKPGLTEELKRRLDERGARRSTRADNFVYEPEEMKILLEELCQEAGVDVHLHTRLAAAYPQGGRLSTVVTESKSGRQAWHASTFIDATGDGDLGALAGCGWDVGQQADCPCQPMTLNALVVVENASELSHFMSFYGDTTRHIPAVEAFRGELARAGVTTSYGHPTLFHVRDDLVLLMINHEYNVKPFDEPAITSATLRARGEVFRVVRALRTLGGPWSKIQVAATAEQIGVRDGRRIHGRYTVSKPDLVSGARHPDAVARVTFGADIHAADRATNDKETISHGGFPTRPYDIPLRALIARDVDGLLTAGRCISGDFIAHASYRVTGNAVAMGEAAGATASIAARTRRLPHEVPWSEVASALEILRRPKPPQS